MLAEPDEKTKAAYVNAWRRLLKEFFGWSEAQIDQWLSGKSDLLRNSFLNHEDPSWWVIDLLIPQDLQRPGGERIVIRNEIAPVLQSFWSAEPPYEEIRQRIGEIIAQHRKESHDGKS